MKTDLYTKAVLTVIALALVCLCALQLTPVAHAQPEITPQRVVVTGFEGSVERALPVKIVGIDRGQWVAKDEWGKAYPVRHPWVPIPVHETSR